jgi:molecular chaperone GrpE (heat shock protein)
MSVEVSEEWMSELAVLAWRISRCATQEGGDASQVRYVARRMSSLLEEAGLETIDLAGQVFSAGLALEVVDAFHSPEGDRPLRIAEVITPIVQLNGRVVRFGQVTLQPIQEKELP